MKEEMGASYEHSATFKSILGSESVKRSSDEKVLKTPMRAPQL